MSARAEKRNTIKANDRARGRVLLIADDDQTQFVEAVTSRGMNVVGVASGAAALVSLQRSRPHLVVANP
jgi:PleD family two-component response regulator